jgi:hypothetical protein
LALQGAGQRLAPLLIQRLLKANDDWRAASAAVQMLLPALHNHAAHDLASHLRAVPTGVVEVSRMIIEALGRLGAAGYAGDLVRRLVGKRIPEFNISGRYHWDKLAIPATIALVRMVRWCGDVKNSWAELGRDSSMDVLASFLTEYKEQRDVHGALWHVYREMRGLRAWHADRLIRDFLQSADQMLVDMGATALGHMRLTRGVPAIIRRLKDSIPLSPDVERNLLLEIARIGSPAAVEFLLGEGSRFAAASMALRRCLDSAPDSQFEALVHQGFEEAPANECWWIYRAIGQRPLPSLVGYLEHGLVSNEPSDRGVAALALAKAEGSACFERVTTAHHEASNSNEKSLTAVALLVAGGDLRPVESVEETLISEVLLYEPVLFDDIARALEGWGGHRGLELATGLRWLSTAP